MKLDCGRVVKELDCGLLRRTKRVRLDESLLGRGRGRIRHDRRSEQYGHPRAPYTIWYITNESRDPDRYSN